jgi:hypothetical protein
MTYDDLKDKEFYYVCIHNYTSMWNDTGIFKVKITDVKLDGANNPTHYKLESVSKVEVCRFCDIRDKELDSKCFLSYEDADKEFRKLMKGQRDKEVLAIDSEYEDRLDYYIKRNLEVCNENPDIRG